MTSGPAFSAAPTIEVTEVSKWFGQKVAVSDNADILMEQIETTHKEIAAAVQVSAETNKAVEAEVAVLTARDLRPDLYIIGRAETEDAERKLMRAGANRVVSPYVMGGRRIANRNLWLSMPALLLAFAVWVVWSVIVVQLPHIGYKFSTNQLFWLAAMPGLAGGTLRLVHTFLIPIFGTRNVITVATLAKLLPCVGLGFAILDPSTPYWIFMVLALLAGMGGGAAARPPDGHRAAPPGQPSLVPRPMRDDLGELGDKRVGVGTAHGEDESRFGAELADAEGEGILDAWLSERTHKVLDLCTGNGSLAVLAGMVWPETRIDAADLSVDALAVARLNVERHGLAGRISLHAGDSLSAVAGRR